MGLSTKKILSRKEKVVELKEKHRNLIDLIEEDYDKIKFIPKSAYNPAPGKEKIISFFPSELNSGEDIYTEFVSKELVPEDPERRLWKWPFNPYWETEYEKSEPHPATGDRRYLVPVEELIDVTELIREKVVTKYNLQQTETITKSELDFDSLPDPDNDAPMSEMTMRDECAIRWQLPVSRKKWLNELIRETFKK